MIYSVLACICDLFCSCLQLSPKELVDTVSFRHGSLQPGVHSMAASSLLFRSASFFNAQSPQSPPSAPLSPRADFGVPMMPSSSGSSAVSFGCMQLELSRFARKLGNTGYAGRLLVQAVSQIVHSKYPLLKYTG